MSTCGGELTSEEADLVKHFWASLKENRVEIAYTFFKILFKNNPDYRQLFPFRDVHESDLLENPIFINHCNNSFVGLSLLMGAIDDPEKLRTICSTVIESHKKKNLTENHFINFTESVIELLSSMLNEEQLEAFKKTMNMVTDIIVKGYEKEANK